MHVSAGMICLKWRFLILISRLKLVYLLRCPEKQNKTITLNLSSCGPISAPSCQTVQYGPDHPLGEKKSHLGGHSEEVNHFSRTIIGTNSICTTSCQICCWCSKKSFLTQTCRTGPEFQFLLNTIIYGEWHSGPERRFCPERQTVWNDGWCGCRLGVAGSSSAVPWTVVVVVSLGSKRHL